MADRQIHDDALEWTSVVLVRHGETDWNVTRRIQGQRPVGLNARGRAQAAAAAERLAGEAIAAVYSSDLTRALQTAEAIAERHGLQPVLDARLREWALGVLEGMLCEEAEARHPEAYSAFRTEEPDYVIPGGESIRQRYARSTAALSEIAGRHPGGCVVVVTHGGVLDDVYRRTMGLSLDSRKDFRIYNGGLNEIRISGETWTMVAWGEIGHLEAIGSLGEW